jgi:hypothetical protein
MEENKEEENLNESLETQSENSQNEITPTQDLETIHSTQETEHMEVHHHAHDPAAPHHKKNWKNYFWEFLMLFLAVFCGFLAEYQLEHKIEKERGNQYVQSMIEDLELDLTKINKSLEFCKYQKSGLDSLSVLLNNNTSSDIDIKKEYLLMSKYTMNIGTVLFTKRTISQLKNSGGMRLLTNKISVDEIIKYSESVEDAENQGLYFTDVSLNEVSKLNNKIFFLKYLKELDLESSQNRVSPTSMKLANDDKNLLIEYSNNIILTSEVLDTYISLLADLKSKIPKTIEILKQENHIK